jgi:hypothetical protein
MILFSETGSMGWRILYNPLAVLGRRAGLATTYVVVLGLTAAVWWGGEQLCRTLLLYAFPGAPSLPLLFAEVVIAWLCVGIILWIVSYIFGGEADGGMHLAAAGLSRLPFVAAAIILSQHISVGLAIRRFAFAGADKPMPPIVMEGIAGIILLVIWGILMLYFGYKEASRLRGITALVSFTMGMVLAELASKYLVHLLVEWG